MKLVVFHPGTQHSWQTATALQQLNLLEYYATSIFYQPARWPYRMERYVPEKMRIRLHAEFSRFEHKALDPSLVRTAGIYEWAERIAARAGFTQLSQKIDKFGNQRFAQLLEKDIRDPRPFAIWGYNSSSLETFRAARAAGRPTILDRTIGDWRYYNIAMADAFERYAGWSPAAYRAVGPEVIARDDEEYGQSDYILCGSEACAQTIRDHAPDPGVAAKLRVLPYCFDAQTFADVPAPRPLDRNGPVRFLFVGQLGLRKGVQHVLEAIAQLPPGQAELTLVGQLNIAKGALAPYRDRVNYIPTVPRSAIPQIMAEHHVMIFPSYFEGSSLSLLESLASGLALIQTDQAGNGVTPDTGIRMARPDSEVTLEAMLRVIEDRDLLDHFRSNAQAEAANYTFARYRDNIAALLAQTGVS